MIQDIEPKKLNNQYIKGEPGKNDRILIYRKRALLMKSTGKDPVRYELPLLSDPLFKDMNPRYALSIDDVGYYLCPDDDIPETGSYEFTGLNFFRFSAQKELCFAAVTGYHLYRWYISNRFCGKCGSPMEYDTSSTALNCTKCRNRMHPRINPAVIIAVTDGEKLLMAKHTKNPGFPHALLAGFCEIGESAEQTVSREVMEEVGIRVKNIRYYGSQPWGVAGNLSLGYVCEPENINAAPDPDESEIAHAAWFTRDEIDYDLGTASLTGTMILDFKNGKLQL